MLSFSVNLTTQDIQPLIPVYQDNADKYGIDSATNVFYEQCNQLVSRRDYGGAHETYDIDFDYKSRRFIDKYASALLNGRATKKDDKGKPLEVTFNEVEDFAKDLEDELYVQHALDVLLVQGGLEEVLISEGVNLFVYFKKFYNNKLWSVDKENHQRNINLLLGALKENGIELEELNQKMFVEGLVAYFKKDSNIGGNSYGGFKIVSE